MTSIVKVSAESVNDNFVNGDEVRGAYVQFFDEVHKIKFFYNDDNIAVYKDGVDSYDIVNSTMSSVSKENVLNFDLIEKIMYYGYGYDDHDTQKWYVVTQVEIWKQIYGVENVNYIDSDYLIDNEKYKEEVDILYDLIAKHEIRPEIKDNKAYYKVKFDILDKAGVLDNYEVVPSDKFNAKIANNVLSLTALDVENFNLQIKKEFNNYNDTAKVYVDETALVLVPGNLETIVHTFNFDVVYSTLIIDANVEMPFMTDSDLIVEYELLDQNKVFLDNVNYEFGKPLKIFRPGKEYTLRRKNQDKVFVPIEEEHTFKLTSGSEYVLDIQPKFITNKLIIKKFNQNKENNLLIEDNESIFKIYETLSDKYRELVFENGIAEIDLGYGDYKLVHEVGNEQYQILDNIYFSVRDDGEVIEKELISKDLTKVYIPDTFASINYWYLIGGCSAFLGSKFCKKSKN